MEKFWGKFIESEKGISRNSLNISKFNQKYKISRNQNQFLVGHVWKLNIAQAQR